MITKIINCIKSKLKDLYINYTYKKIIKSCKKISYDQETQNEALEHKKDLLLNTGAILIKNYASDQKYFDYFDEFHSANFSEISKDYPNYSYPVIFDKNTIVEKILLDLDLNYLIKSYLGNDARLDIISFSYTRTNSLNKIVSEKWHYDNVGNRLKLFFFLNSNMKISTDYISSTNKIFHKIYSTSGSRASLEKVNKLKNNIVKFYPEKGNILLFDTNGYHKGNYTENLVKSKDEDDKSRLMIRFEFSSKIKSEKFYDKSDIIGPRSTFFSNEFNINDCELIDKSCISKIGQIFFYDTRYILNR